MFLWLGNPSRKEDIHVWWKAPNKIRYFSELIKGKWKVMKIRSAALESCKILTRQWSGILCPWVFEFFPFLTPCSHVRTILRTKPLLLSPVGWSYLCLSSSTSKPSTKKPQNKEQQPGRSNSTNPILSDEVLPKRGITAKQRVSSEISNKGVLYSSSLSKSLSEVLGHFWKSRAPSEKGKGLWLWRFVARKQTKGLVFFMAFTQTK